MNAPTARISTIIVSRVNGPGLRATIWFQGCSFHCPGCFNPGTHSNDGGSTMSAYAVVDRILAIQDAHPDLEGITFSGGEPLQQADALETIVDALRQMRPALSLVMFTGYTPKEIKRDPQFTRICERLDTYIAGRFILSKRVGAGAVGSANKKFIHVSKRYSKKDFEQVAPAEVTIRPDGTLILSGVGPRGAIQA